jgi:hypothetical protein
MVTFVKFYLSLTVLKLFDFLCVNAKCYLKILGKGYSPERSCSSMRPQTVSPCINPRRLPYIVRANQFSGLVCRIIQGKK